jgi:hypothetical protein
MGRWLSSVNGRARRGAVVSIAAIALAAGLPGCREQKADRLYRDAAKKVERGDLAGAVERFERVLREYPGTRAAERATSDVTLYRGLLEASRRFPHRRAADLIIQTARAVERFRHANRRPPASLEELVPEYLSSRAQDPWSRPLEYRLKPSGGYVLACRGADGAEGGDGENSDVVVEDGRFVTGGPEGPP